MFALECSFKQIVEKTFYRFVGKVNVTGILYINKYPGSLLVDLDKSISIIFIHNTFNIHTMTEVSNDIIVI